MHFKNVWSHRFIEVGDENEHKSMRLSLRVKRQQRIALKKSLKIASHKFQRIHSFNHNIHKLLIFHRIVERLIMQETVFSQ